MNPSLKAIVERCGGDNFHLLGAHENDRLMPIILELCEVIEEQQYLMREMVYQNARSYGNMETRNPMSMIALAQKECLDSTTKRLEQLAGLEREGKGE
jgi:hypothetical protein